MGATASTRNFGSTGPVGAKSPILNRYSLVAPHRNTAKKVQLTLIGSPLRAFQWA